MSHPAGADVTDDPDAMRDIDFDDGMIIFVLRIENKP